MTSWGSYPSIFGPGHREFKRLMESGLEVNVEEKVDGSQFSFGYIPVMEPDGALLREVPGVYELKVRSKGAIMYPDAPEKMFAPAVETVKSIQHLLTPGWTYRGEVLSRPKHNALAYDRIPKGSIILFDVNTGNQEYLSYEDKVKEAERLGLEVVPRLFTGRVTTADTFRKFLESVSILGGQKIEGVVVKPKNYDFFGTDKKVILGKFVSENFKEVHRKTWGESNPGSADILERLGTLYRHPVRWNKVIQHLREDGVIKGVVQDIGPIIKLIPEDVLKECEDEIKAELFKWAWPHLRRQITRGFPEYYKELLLKDSFENVGDERLPDGGPIENVAGAGGPGVVRVHDGAVAPEEG